MHKSACHLTEKPQLNEISFWLKKLGYLIRHHKKVYSCTFICLGIPLYKWRVTYWIICRHSPNFFLEIKPKKNIQKSSILFYSTQDYFFLEIC